MTAARYSRGAMWLHWIGALAVIANLAIGYWMEAQPRGPGRMEVFQLHLSMGVTVLLLSLIRLGWRIAVPPPRLPETLPMWQRRLSHATHVGFYLLLIGLPLSGWLIASASPLDLPKRWFGLWPWPDLPVETSRTVARAVAGVHGLMVKALFVLLALHLGGVLRHLVARDGPGLRMLPRPVGRVR